MKPTRTEQLSEALARVQALASRALAGPKVTATIRGTLEGIVETALRARLDRGPRCKYCGCSEFNACMTPFGGCAWVSRRPPVCSAASCMAKWKKEQRRGQGQDRAGIRRPKTRAPRVTRSTRRKAAT